MVFVKVREGESIEEVLRRFKRDVLRNGILKEVRRREAHQPPSVEKKLKRKEAERKMRRKASRSS